jgi:DNA-binding SARP family transcriptional activator
MNTSSAKLRIHLLGAVQIFYGDQKLPIQRRFQRSLLFYLACQREPVGRTRLIDLLWPDEDETQARRHLREALSKLRQQLPEPDLLVADQDYIYLDPQRTYTDVREFQTLVEQVQPYLKRRSERTLPEGIYQQMYRAVRLWREPEFIAGASLPNSVGLERWWTMTAQALDYHRQLLLETLAGHAQSAGDLDNAVQWLRLALEKDEENLYLYQRLLTCLRDLRRFDEALRVCRTLHDLPVELSEALEDLCRQVQDAALRPAPAAAEPWHNTLTLQLPFVGRKALLNDLRMALQRGGVEVIWGEAGSGKSRLGVEFYQLIDPPPRLILASARFHTQSFAFQPLIDALRCTVTHEEWLQLPEAWAAILMEVLPDLAALHPSAPPPARLPAIHPGPQRIYEAFAQVFDILGRRQRLLIFLDDAQWSDADTLYALAYLLNQRRFTENGLLVISARLEEPAAALHAFLQHAPLAWRLRQTYLALLTHEEIAELSRYAFGQPLPNALVERLRAETGGNALFLLETLRTWLDHGLKPEQFSSAEEIPLASTIHSLASERKRLLSPPAQQALSAAAVIGESFSPKLLSGLLVWDEEQTLAVLEELERTRLIRLAEQDAPLYDFIHTQIRAVLLAELSPARRQALNLRTAQVLQQQGLHSPAEMRRAARHFQAGGDFQSAFRWWVNAGVASAGEDHDRALSDLRQAELLLPQLQNRAPHELVHSLYTTWTGLTLQAGRLEEAERVNKMLLNFGEQVDAPALIGSAYYGLANTAAQRGQNRRALTYLEQAAPFLRQAGSLQERLEGARQQAQQLNQLLRYHEAIRVLEDITRLDFSDQNLPIRRALGWVYIQLALTLLNTGQYRRSAAAAQNAVEIFQTALDAPGMANAALATSLLDLHTGTYARGLARLQEAKPQLAQLNNSSFMAYVCALEAALYTALGQLDDAWHAQTDALRLADANHLSTVQSWVYSIRGDAFFFLRAYDQAVEAHRQSLDISSEHVAAISSLARLGSALVMNGQRENGFTFLRRAIDLSSQTDLDLVRLRAELFQSAGLLLAGYPREALHQAAQTANEIERRGGGMQSIPYYWISASVHEHDQPEEALESARQLITRAHNAGSPFFELSGIELALRLPLDYPERRLWRTQGRQILKRIQIQTTQPELLPALAGYIEKLQLPG